MSRFGFCNDPPTNEWNLFSHQSVVAHSVLLSDSLLAFRGNYRVTLLLRPKLSRAIGLSLCARLSVPTLTFVDVLLAPEPYFLFFFSVALQLSKFLYLFTFCP
jgi:hypothetical protein